MGRTEKNTTSVNKNEIQMALFANVLVNVCEDCHVVTYEIQKGSDGRVCLF